MQKEAANSIITVDLKQIKKNIESIKNYLAPGTELMITVKSNGYGHGLVKPACYIRNNCGIDKFATSMVSEAVELREAGINCFMMVLGGIPYEAVPIVVEYDLVVPAYDPVFLSLLSDEAVKQRKTVKAHIKIDTGLRRLGVRLGAQLDELVEHVKNTSRHKDLKVLIPTLPTRTKKIRPLLISNLKSLMQPSAKSKRRVLH